MTPDLRAGCILRESFLRQPEYAGMMLNQTVLEPQASGGGNSADSLKFAATLLNQAVLKLSLASFAPV